jgi:hypothetical protein
VNVETCVVPVEDFLHQGKADELFLQQQREDLVGEDFLDDLIVETRDAVKSAIRGCATRFLISKSYAESYVNPIKNPL